MPRILPGLVGPWKADEASRKSQVVFRDSWAMSGFRCHRAADLRHEDKVDRCLDWSWGNAQCCAMYSRSALADQQSCKMPTEQSCDAYT